MYLALVPLAMTVAFALTARRLAALLSGRAAAVLLTVGSLVCALASGLVLCAIACLSLAQFAPFARLGRWSTSVVRASDPVPAVVAGVCGTLAIVLLAASFVRIVGSARRLTASARLCRSHQRRDAADGLLVLRDTAPEAYALAGWPGLTVVTSGMLRCLTAAERRALLAHEWAHVAHHHFLYVQLTTLAATANPVLWPLVHTVHLAVERWADEDAVASVGDDRGLVVDTLARAGLARSGYRDRIPVGALAAARSEVAQRVDALLAPAALRVPRAVIAAGLSAVVLCAALSSLAVGLHSHDIVEAAQQLRGAAHR